MKTINADEENKGGQGEEDTVRTVEPKADSQLHEFSFDGRKFFVRLNQFNQVRVLQGYLKKLCKEGSMFFSATFEMRFCVMDMNNMCFKYAKSPKEEFTVIEMEELVSCNFEDPKRNKPIKIKNQKSHQADLKYLLYIIGRKRTYVISANTRSDQVMWFNGFQVFFKVKHVVNLVKNGAAFSKQSLQMLQEARAKEGLRSKTSSPPARSADVKTPKSTAAQAKRREAKSKEQAIAKGSATQQPATNVGLKGKFAAAPVDKTEEEKKVYYAGQSKKESIEVHLKDGTVVEKKGEINRMQVVPALGAQKFQEKKLMETFSPKSQDQNLKQLGIKKTGQLSKKVDPVMTKEDKVSRAQKILQANFLKAAMMENPVEREKAMSRLQVLQADLNKGESLSAIEELGGIDKQDSGSPTNALQNIMKNANNKVEINSTQIELAKVAEMKQKQQQELEQAQRDLEELKNKTGYHSGGQYEGVDYDDKGEVDDDEYYEEYTYESIQPLESSAQNIKLSADQPAEAKKQQEPQLMPSANIVAERGSSQQKHVHVVNSLGLTPPTSTNEKQKKFQNLQNAAPAPVVPIQKLPSIVQPPPSQQVAKPATLDNQVSYYPSSVNTRIEKNQKNIENRQHSSKDTSLGANKHSNMQQYQNINFPQPATIVTMIQEPQITSNNDQQDKLLYPHQFQNNVIPVEIAPKMLIHDQFNGSQSIKLDAPITLRASSNVPLHEQDNLNGGLNRQIELQPSASPMQLSYGQSMHQQQTLPQQQQQQQIQLRPASSTQPYQQQRFSQSNVSRNVQPQLQSHRQPPDINSSTSQQQSTYVQKSAVPSNNVVDMLQSLQTIQVDEEEDFIEQAKVNAARQQHQNQKNNDFVKSETSLNMNRPNGSHRQYQNNGMQSNDNSIEQSSIEGGGKFTESPPAFIIKPFEESINQVEADDQTAIKAMDENFNSIVQDDNQDDFDFGDRNNFYEPDSQQYQQPYGQQQIQQPTSNYINDNQKNININQGQRFDSQSSDSGSKFKVQAQSKVIQFSSGPSTQPIVHSAAVAHSNQYQVPGPHIQPLNHANNYRDDQQNEQTNCGQFLITPPTNYASRDTNFQQQNFQSQQVNINTQSLVEKQSLSNQLHQNQQNQQVSLAQPQPRADLKHGGNLQRQFRQQSKAVVAQQEESEGGDKDKFMHEKQSAPKRNNNDNIILGSSVQIRQSKTFKHSQEVAIVDKWQESPIKQAQQQIQQPQQIQAQQQQWIASKKQNQDPIQQQTQQAWTNLHTANKVQEDRTYQQRQEQYSGAQAQSNKEVEEKSIEEVESQQPADPPLTSDESQHQSTDNKQQWVEVAPIVYHNQSNTVQQQVAFSSQSAVAPKTNSSINNEHQQQVVEQQQQVSNVNVPSLQPSSSKQETQQNIVQNQNYPKESSSRQQMQHMLQSTYSVTAPISTSVFQEKMPQDETSQSPIQVLSAKLKQIREDVNLKFKEKSVTQNQASLQKPTTEWNQTSLHQTTSYKTQQMIQPASQFESRNSSNHLEPAVEIKLSPRKSRQKQQEMSVRTQLPPKDDQIFFEKSNNIRSVEKNSNRGEYMHGSDPDTPPKKGKKVIQISYREERQQQQQQSSVVEEQPADLYYDNGNSNSYIEKSPQIMKDDDEANLFMIANDVERETSKNDHTYTATANQDQSVDLNVFLDGQTEPVINKNTFKTFLESKPLGKQNNLLAGAQTRNVEFKARAGGEWEMQDTTSEPGNQSSLNLQAQNSRRATQQQVQKNRRMHISRLSNPQENSLLRNQNLQNLAQSSQFVNNYGADDSQNNISTNTNNNIPLSQDYIRARKKIMKNQIAGFAPSELSQSSQRILKVVNIIGTQNTNRDSQLSSKRISHIRARQYKSKGEKVTFRHTPSRERLQTSQQSQELALRSGFSHYQLVPADISDYPNEYPNGGTTKAIGNLSVLSNDDLRGKNQQARKNLLLLSNQKGAHKPKPITSTQFYPSTNLNKLLDQMDQQDASADKVSQDNPLSEGSSVSSKGDLGNRSAILPKTSVVQGKSGHQINMLSRGDQPKVQNKEKQRQSLNKTTDIFKRTSTFQTQEDLSPSEAGSILKGSAVPSMNFDELIHAQRDASILEKMEQQQKLKLHRKASNSRQSIESQKKEQRDEQIKARRQRRKQMAQQQQQQQQLLAQQKMQTTATAQGRQPNFYQRSQRTTSDLTGIRLQNHGGAQVNKNSNNFNDNQEQQQQQQTVGLSNMFYGHKPAAQQQQNFQAQNKTPQQSDINNDGDADSHFSEEW